MPPQQEAPVKKIERTLLPLQPSWLSTESFGLVLLFVSASLYSVMGVFLKLAASPDDSSSSSIPSTQLVCIRAIFQGSLVLLAMCFCRDGSGRRILWQPLGATWEIQRIVILRGAVGGMGFLLYYYTLAALPLGDGIALLSLKSVVTIFLGRLVLGEAIRAVHVAVACASITGAVLIAQPTFLFGSDPLSGTANSAPAMSSSPSSSQHQIDQGVSSSVPTLGYVSALLGACCASSVLILIRKAGSVGAHTLQLLFAWASFGFAFSSLIGLATTLEEEAWHWPSSRRVCLYIFFMCAVGSAGHFLLNFAGKLAPAGPAAVVRSADLAMAYVWEILVFHQHPTVLTLSGVILIATAILTLAMDKVRQERRLQSLNNARELVSTSDDEDELDDVEMIQSMERKSRTTGLSGYSHLNSNVTSEDATEEESLDGEGDEDSWLL